MSRGRRRLRNGKKKCDRNGKKKCDKRNIHFNHYTFIISRNVCI